MADITEILDKLLERTTQGKVPWKSTAGEQTFVAVIGNLSVMILRDAGHQPALKILDKSGREIDVLDADRSEGRKWREDLWRLHEEARRVALDIGTQLDELLKELEKDA